MQGAKGNPSKSAAMDGILDQVIKDRQLCLPDDLIESFVEQAMTCQHEGGTNQEILNKLDVCIVFV